MTMRNTAGGLCLFTMLAISLLAAPLYANEQVTPRRTVIASKYDMSKEVTLQGTVQSLVKEPSSGAIPGAHLMVATGRGTVDAHIGNLVFRGNAMTFTAGQPVKLTGIMTTFNHQNVFLVRTMQVEGKTITVRSHSGFLVSPETMARLARYSPAGGVQ
jgi:hypothetical protein